MPAQDTWWTPDMVRALPDDGNRYEVLDGTLLVSPAPTLRHQRAVKILVNILDPYTRRHGLGETTMSPADIQLTPNRLVQPDVLVIPAELKATDWKDVTHLLLVAEVLSPSTARFDRMEKRLAYRDKGIPEYWLVDVDARVVERWRPSDERPEILSDVLEWHPAQAVPPLSIDLVSYFAEVWS